MGIRDLSPSTVYNYESDFKQWMIYVLDNQGNVSRDGDTVTMIVKDIAMPQRSYITGDWSNFDWGKNTAVGSTMFANWIEHGLWMDIAKWNQMGRPNDNKPKRPKREFVSPVQVEAAMIVKTALHGL